MSFCRSGGALSDRNMFRFVDYDGAGPYPDWYARPARLAAGNDGSGFRFVSKRSPDPAATAGASAGNYGGFMRNLREGDDGRRYLLWRKIAGK